MMLRTVPALLPVIAAVALAGSAQAATLEQIDYQFDMTRNGQPVPHSEQGMIRALPSEVQFEMTASILAETSEEQPDFIYLITSEMTGVWEIQPEAGELAGDPVCYQYSYVGAISAESAGQAAGGVAIGGEAPHADGQADADAATFSYDVDVTGPGGLGVNGLGSVLSFGPTEVVSGEATDLSETGTFLTAIGDFFSFQQSVAVAAVGVHTGSADVQAATQVTITETELAHCYPAIGLGPEAVDFTDQEVGTSSDPLSVTIENTGHADLEVDNLTAPTEPFAAAGGSCGEVPFVLAAGAACTLDYSFSPMATGPASQSITLASNAPDAPHQFELRGNGVQAGIALAPDAIDFGDREVGSSSEPASITVENTGDANLEVDSITAPTAPFAAAGGSCGPAPFVLAPGAACTLDYNFSPTATGLASQSITLASNAPEGPREFELLGVGIQAQTVLSLDDVDFGEHRFGASSEIQSITISNGGDADLVIDGIGNPEPPFEITGGSCYPLPATIAPGENCTIEARMSPRLWSGTFGSEIVIFSNSPSSPDRVSLRGTSPAPLPVPMLGIPAAVLLILSILAITGRSNRQRAIS